jgi:tetratricopeptide (TPR) repeat protein
MGIAPALARNSGSGSRSPAAASASPSSTDTPDQPRSAPSAQTDEAARRNKNYKSEPLNLHRGTGGAAAAAELARSRMKRGEYASALDAFDEAILASPDPTLYRDRGMCHDELQQPYPAIDDFRVYLTAQPDAPDAESVGDRLASLEREVRESTAKTDSDAGAQEHVAVRAMGGEASPSAWSTVTSDSASAAADADSDAPGGSLRRGSGFSLGPVLSLHKWQSTDLSFDDAQTWAESVGLLFRYSFGGKTALLVELGYEHFNTTGSGPTEGLTSQVALEFRFPLDPSYDNQLTLAPGIGFEYVVLESDVASVSSTSEGAIVPRLRFGWRHLIGPSTAFDVALDAGYTRFSSYDSFPYDSNAPDTIFLGLDVAAHWAL